MKIVKGQKEYAILGQYGSIHWAEARFLDPVVVFRYDNMDTLRKKHAVSDPNKSKSKKVVPELRKKVNRTDKVSKKSPAPKKRAVRKKDVPPKKRISKKKAAELAELAAFKKIPDASYNPLAEVDPDPQSDTDDEIDELASNTSTPPRPTRRRRI